MVRIEIEVRYANSMDGVPDYYEVSRQDIIKKLVLSSLEACYSQFPELLSEAFSFTPDKRWNELPEKGYLFREDLEDSRMFPCFLSKKPINMPTGEILPIYVYYPELERNNATPIVITYSCD